MPELSLGCGFVIGGVLGYAPETVVLSSDFLSPSLEANILLATQIAIRVAAAAALFFTWRVFRPDTAWATALAVGLIAALVVSWFAFPQTKSYAQSATETLWYQVFTFARSACIASGAIESFAYYARMRQRYRIGLTDPMLTNRFLLWGIGLSSMTILMASTLLADIAGVNPATPAWVVLESCAGVVGATTLWLTFFPSRAYRAYIERGTSPAEV